MEKRSIWIKVLVCVFPFIAVSLIYLFRNNIIKLGTLFPSCPSYTLLDIYCPGCGNTRSVQHLLKGDILGSLKFNIVPIFGIVLGTLAYLELITFLFGKRKKLVPRNRKFWSIIIIVFSIYFVLRNFILLF